jgi:ABC-type antimicrobial peptide transport system permease subunit
MDYPAVYREMLVYIGCVLLISLMVFWLILAVFRLRNLNLSIRRSNKKLFRKISVVVQLVISIGFAFCSIGIVKQMYFLHHTDELGFSFRNRGAIRVFDEGYNGVLINLMQQIPEISKTVDAQTFNNLLPQGGRGSQSVNSWDDKPADAERVNIEIMRVSPEYIAFYDFRLLAGEMLTEADPDSLILLNESAVKAFGWHDPVGKHFDGFTVKGVIKNVYNYAPTVQVSPILYLQHFGENARARASGSPLVLFEYQEGMWKSSKEKIERLIKIEHADLNFALINYEEEYNKFLKSENALIKLLSLVSVFCALICIFGFVSLVSLTCEERRKTIAIRKINGATVGDILSMFGKEYALLLVIGAAIAFPAAFYIMQRWLEQYVKQTSIPAWIYVSILCVLALMIVFCVGWQVYKTSVENPAEVIKME